MNAPARIVRSRGLSLIELMIAITLGMLIVAALVALYINVTRTDSEMAKANRQIENGRFAIQLLQDDVEHAGFWGAYVPQFDDLTTVTAPLDAPKALPDPCLAYSSANWDGNYLSDIIGIPVQGDAGTCAGAGGVIANQQANTDVLVVRHAMNCVAGVGNCEADTKDKLYFQSSLCETEIGGLAQGGTDDTITLDAGASSTDDYYKGVQIRIIYGTGVGQSATITAYNGTTKVASIAPATWGIKPINDSVYAIGLGYVLGISDGTPDGPPFIFHQRGNNCALPAVKRKFVSNLYYIRDYAVTAGDGIPTLMQSTFDLSGTTLAQQPAQALIEGIEGFRVMYGIDSLSKGGTAEDYTKAVAWTDPYNKVTPTNRGDGVAEGAYLKASGVTCTGANTCPAANVVAVRIYVLARNLEPTAGYTDKKTYVLGDPSYTMGPFNDHFKRHVYSTTVRLVNPSSRRDTP
ncbi:MAG: PilW family protein [Betaproteobacteria bacterium]|nr:PilW family protein [Betaproteobacteria bacterium]